MKNEIWAEIKGYEGYYEVSTLGRVRSLDRVVYFKNGNVRKYIGKILKQKYHNGYAMVNLNKNKKLEVLYVHRLVAETFLLHRRGRNWVNHKNGIKSDNRVENLEWCAPSYNNKHAVDNSLRTNNISGLLEHNISQRKEVVAIMNNKIIHIADCSRAMAEYLLKHGFIREVSIETAARTIRRVCNGELKLYKNINFQFIVDN